jgi:hypothetical protein
MQSHQDWLKRIWEYEETWSNQYLGGLLHFIPRVTYRVIVTDIMCYSKNVYIDHWGRLESTNWPKHKSSIHFLQSDESNSMEAKKFFSTKSTKRQLDMHME